MPLPRFCVPDTLKCLITLTNDGEYKSELDFEPHRDVDSLGANVAIFLVLINYHVQAINGPEVSKLQDIPMIQKKPVTD
jgi:hypothetical protein